MSINDTEELPSLVEYTKYSATLVLPLPVSLLSAFSVFPASTLLSSLLGSVMGLICGISVGTVPLSSFLHKKQRIILKEKNKKVSPIFL